MTHSFLRSSSLAWLGLAGCVIDTTSDDPILVDRTGYLTVDWTIAGRVDPVLCDDYVVDALEIVVYDEFGNYVTEIESPCEAFTLTVELFPGIYDADATLVGFRDEAATSTEPLADLRILTDSELVVDLDFPSGSFL